MQSSLSIFLSQYADGNKDYYVSWEWARTLAGTDLNSASSKAWGGGLARAGLIPGEYTNSNWYIAGYFGCPGNSGTIAGLLIKTKGLVHRERTYGMPSGFKAYKLNGGSYSYVRTVAFKSTNIFNSMPVRHPKASEFPYLIDAGGRVGQVFAPLYNWSSNAEALDAIPWGRHNNRSNALFLDGHVKSMARADFANLLGQSAWRQ